MKSKEIAEALEKYTKAEIIEAVAYALEGDHRQMEILALLDYIDYRHDLAEIEKTAKKQKDLYKEYMDWHNEYKKFFDEMATKYGGYKNAPLEELQRGAKIEAEYRKAYEAFMKA